MCEGEEKQQEYSWHEVRKEHRCLIVEQIHELGQIHGAALDLYIPD